MQKMTQFTNLGKKISNRPKLYFNKKLTAFPPVLSKMPLINLLPKNEKMTDSTLLGQKIQTSIRPPPLPTNLSKKWTAFPLLWQIYHRSYWHNINLPDKKWQILQFLARRFQSSNRPKKLYRNQIDSIFLGFHTNITDRIVTKSHVSDNNDRIFRVRRELFNRQMTLKILSKNDSISPCLQLNYLNQLVTKNHQKGDTIYPFLARRFQTSIRPQESFTKNGQHFPWSDNKKS